MNSIDQQQPESNHCDLSGPDAVQRIRDMVDDAKTCFFCTAGGVRPMSPLEVDDQGNLWFLSADDSHKNDELHASPSVRLYFQGSARSGFLYLDGQAEVSRNEARIHELWNFALKTWFTQGEADPRITVIRVTPTQGYYWDNKHGDAVAGAKIMAGAVLGKTLDDSIQGALRL
ncbi:hypothetical protein GCM10027277_11930 [Pseudoduganella ginsengisoli]|uniref:General stress protein n=1 Tax=Pseudoduganella ginsengisoli TaxID=1462440 RepID=A0A6L6PVW2_9BURK|nr:pyridoxamine 5'-phosphate oxidase family protein [Pseudoduganella ginsengisoli]MTW01585.1 general stress protein [Pseudoduganella ginsengisoli]